VFAYTYDQSGSTSALYASDGTKVVSTQVKGKIVSMAAQLGSRSSHPYIAVISNGQTLVYQFSGRFTLVDTIGHNMVLGDSYCPLSVEVADVFKPEEQAFSIFSQCNTSTSGNSLLTVSSLYLYYLSGKSDVNSKIHRIPIASSNSPS